MGGKLILIKHVLNSMSLYLLQALRPPKVVLVSLGRVFNAFLWDKLPRKGEFTGQPGSMFVFQLMRGV